jgi:DNA-binding transcriptional MerR regulator
MPGDADDGAPSTGGTGSTVEVGSTPGTKTEAAFRTIGELAADTGLPQHILRYWETRFPQLRPLQRAGNRRYYRAEDVALVRRIDTLLNREGYTVRGVQQLLSGEKSAPAASASTPPLQVQSPIPALKAIRALLAQALIEDAA